MIWTPPPPPQILCWTCKVTPMRHLFKQVHFQMIFALSFTSNKSILYLDSIVYLFYKQNTGIACTVFDNIKMGGHSLEYVLGLRHQLSVYHRCTNTYGPFSFKECISRSLAIMANRLSRCGTSCGAGTPRYGPACWYGPASSVTLGVELYRN